MAPPATRTAALALAAALLIGSSATAQDWTRFRGPGGQGHGEGTAIPSSFDAKAYRWRVELAGPGHSSPVVWGERLFLTTADPEAGKRWIVCHGTGDGAELWRTEVTFEAHGQHRLNSFASSTPAVDADGVYLAWTTGESLEALALDHAGKRLWRRELGAFRARHGSGSSPLVVGGVVVIGNDNEGPESFLTGLDAATGEEVWRRERESVRASYATPALHRPEDGPAQVLFASTAHDITSLDPLTGALNWEVDGLFTERCVASPVVVGGLVFATAGTGGGGKESVALELAPGEEGGERAVRYRLRRALPYVPTPVAAGGRLFLLSDGGVLSCVSGATGEELWRERVGTHFFGSPICVDDRLFAVATDGELVVVAAADEFQVLGRVDLGEPSQATPAVADGVLYLRTERHLIAVGGEDA